MSDCDMGATMKSSVFWNDYRERLRNHPETSQGLYRTTKKWGDFVIRIAEELLQAQQSPMLDTKRKHFKADLTGVEKISYAVWRVRVAFEHENNNDYNDAWCYELCTLSHIAADLCVLVSY